MSATERTLPDFNGEFQMLPVRQLVVDPRYQRPLKERLIGQIMAEFSWERFGAVSAAMRDEDGLWRVYDGQQRTEAARRLGYLKVPGIVYPLDGALAEALTFAEMNTTRVSVAYPEQYKTLLFARDPAVVAVNEAIESVGFTVLGGTGGAAQWNGIAAIAKLMAAYEKLGAEELRRMFAIIRTVWNGEKAATEGAIIEGLADYIDQFHPERAQLEKALQRTTPSDLLRRSASLRYDLGGTKRVNMHRALRELFGRNPARAK